MMIGSEDCRIWFKYRRLSLLALLSVVVAAGLLEKLPLFLQWPPPTLSKSSLVVVVPDLKATNYASSVRTAGGKKKKSSSDLSSFLPAASPLNGDEEESSSSGRSMQIETDAHKKESSSTSSSSAAAASLLPSGSAAASNLLLEFGVDPFTLAEPAIITEGAHISSPPAIGSCSCWNATAECCERKIHPTHKFGHALVRALFRGPGSAGTSSSSSSSRRDTTAAAAAAAAAAATKTNIVVSDIPTKPSRYFDRDMDYREVFVTREWFEAIVSGYLYHKSGKECWLTPQGEQAKSINEEMYLFEKKYIELPAPYPPVKGRNLCEYLQQESEKDGLRIYAEWVIRKYYNRVLVTFYNVQQYEHAQHRRTMYVCFEDLSRPQTKAATYRAIMDWFYPAGGGGSVVGQPQEQQEQQQEQEEYNGNHSTSHDPTMRDRLRRLAEELDVEVFHGTIRRNSNLFGCGGRGKGQ